MTASPRTFDFLVVGGGIAGLGFAIEAARHGSVGVLFKRGVSVSSTSWAQGGIAAVASADDDPSLHVEDTLRAGCGLCDRAVVESVIAEGPARIADLVELGVRFDSEDGAFHLHREGGHSRRRIYHSADATGSEIQRALLVAASRHPSVTFIPDTSAVDLVTAKKLGLDTGPRDRVVGAYVLGPGGEVEFIAARAVCMASGGAGKVYLYTSNPDVATGDGVAMCFRAGCPVANMEFFQFHPTCLYHPDAKSFLISEAMRGEGAVLRTRRGERFMERHDPRGELAPRDVVARAIDFEMKTSGDESVLLDISHRDPAFVRAHFPTIYERCLGFGFDLTEGPVPVVPAAHFCCGGVVTDSDGLTAVDNLYAAGECAHTGLHGANRLASNSLLEGVVFGRRAALHAASRTGDAPFPRAEVPPWDPGGAVRSEEQVIISQNWDEIRRFMWNYVGIVRSTKRLERALRRSEMIQSEINEYYWNFHLTPDLVELRNLSLVADLVIRCASLRRESRGLHYTLDHPDSDEDYRTDTVLWP